eukprot:TRINITY_DN5359_c0_g1_i1.p1 TRINITY_DN5359_c0_g1~~TRINITY_DN5359_c0_g1_i1.p1  ORF type:complete len:332 (+),score=13.93 TRINITY_DN5359_c0_g1_i1:79-996(+)
MSRWGKKKKEDPAAEVFPSVVEGLKKIYATKIKPLEQLYQFDEFYSPLLKDSDFDAKPMVLLCGQYSTGKTTFIRYLLERDFPGIHIGPEPTTDRFIAIMHGKEELVTPGNALSVQADKPFTALGRFGMDFLNKFQGSHCPAAILEDLTFIDTPGVLSGEKQRIGRSYDFAKITEWFAERSDLILLLFDAHKLDISDEFKRVIESLKVRLNTRRASVKYGRVATAGTRRAQEMHVVSCAKNAKALLPQHTSRRCSDVICPAVEFFLVDFQPSYTIIEVDSHRLWRAAQETIRHIPLPDYKKKTRA